MEQNSTKRKRTWTSKKNPEETKHRGVEKCTGCCLGDVCCCCCCGFNGDFDGVDNRVRVDAVVDEVVTLAGERMLDELDAACCCETVLRGAGEFGARTVTDLTPGFVGFDAAAVATAGTFFGSGDRAVTGATESTNAPTFNLL
jgi:hypothetical protein